MNLETTLHIVILIALNYLLFLDLMFIGELWNFRPVGIEQHQKSVEPPIKGSAQPIGADAISDEYCWVSILVMFLRVFVTTYFPVTDLTSTRKIQRLEDHLPPQSYLNWSVNAWTYGGKSEIYEHQITIFLYN